MNNLAILRAIIMGPAPFDSARQQTHCALNLGAIKAQESSKWHMLCVKKCCTFHILSCCETVHFKGPFQWCWSCAVPVQLDEIVTKTLGSIVLVFEMSLLHLTSG